MVPASTLAGVDDQPAISADRDWFIPANVLRTLAVSGDPFWYQLLVDEKDNVLTTTYEGRYPTDHLRNAIRFRDGICRYPGNGAIAPGASPRWRRKRRRTATSTTESHCPTTGPTVTISGHSWSRRSEGIAATERHHHKLTTFHHATPIPHEDDWAWNTGGTILTE